MTIRHPIPLFWTALMEKMAPFAALGLALLVLGWVIFRSILRRRSRERQRSPADQVRDVKQSFDQRESRGQRGLKDAPADILRWQVEMHDYARELKGELDTKIAILNASIRLADQKILELQSLMDSAGTTNATHESNQDTD